MIINQLQTLKKSIQGSLQNKINFRILNKNVVFEKNYWLIKGSHDGYLREYGIIHERSLEFYPEKNKLIGKDKLSKKIILNPQILKLGFI